MDRIEKLKEFLVANPQDCFVQHALALEYIKDGRDMEARKLFEQVLHINENYTGSYYHLAKLLERTGEKDEVVRCYEKGMLIAQSQKEQHAWNELRAAYEDFID